MSNIEYISFVGFQNLALICDIFMVEVVINEGYKGKVGVMRIILVGVAWVGKSTIGKLLAEIMGYKFFDFDIEVEERMSEVGVKAHRS